MSITHSALDGAQMIPVTLLSPSPTNPRKRFPEAPLRELAASIAKHGVMQPLVARPYADAPAGAPQFEIVCGERRWRAATMAGQDTVPCIVRDLGDLEVLEMQLIENVQRDNLHPLEEAEGYEAMLLEPPHWAPEHRPRLQGYTIDELAARIGKSRSHLYGRLRLLGLAPEARHAFFDDAFGVQSALVIARLKPEQQVEVVQAMLHAADHGAAWTHDTLLHTVRTRYMLRLHQAPFNLADASLVAAAGSCTTCPKRSGSNPELFPDIAEQDTCADPDCYGTKVEAHRARRLAHAAECGWAVVSGADANKLLPARGVKPKGFERLDQPSTLALSHQPLRDVLGPEHIRGITLVDSEAAGELVELMPTAAVRLALKAIGKLREDDPAPPATKAERKPKAEPPTPAAADAPASAQVQSHAPPHAPAVEDDAPSDAESSALLDECLDLPVIPPSVDRSKPLTLLQLADCRRHAHAAYRAVLIAHRIGQYVQRVVMPPIIDPRLARMALLPALDATVLTDRTAARIAGVPMRGERENLHDWAWTLRPEHAYRMLLVTLALQDDGPPFDYIAPAIADVLGIDVQGIERQAAELVEKRLQADLRECAPAAKRKTPAAPKAKPAPKAAAKKAAVPKPSKRKAATAKAVRTPAPKRVKA